MRKADKEFKNDVDKEVAEISYVTKKVGVRILAICIIIAFISGVGGVIYTGTIGKAQKNAEREVFKSSTAYTEEAVQFIAKSYKEYHDADSKDDKNAIIDYVYMRYPNLDPDLIENSDLRSFYKLCIN